MISPHFSRRHFARCSSLSRAGRRFTSTLWYEVSSPVLRDGENFRLLRVYWWMENAHNRRYNSFISSYFACRWRKASLSKSNRNRWREINPNSITSSTIDYLIKSLTFLCAHVKDLENSTDCVVNVSPFTLSDLIAGHLFLVTLTGSLWQYFRCWNWFVLSFRSYFYSSFSCCHTHTVLNCSCLSNLETARYDDFSNHMDAKTCVWLFRSKGIHCLSFFPNLTQRKQLVLICSYGITASRVAPRQASGAWETFTCCERRSFDWIRYFDFL